MSRKRGQLPLTETDREDNDSIPKKAGSPVSDPEPALEALRDAYANLIERLHSPSVIEHLYSGRLLTKVEYDLAKSKESDYDKNTEVLGALMRRGPAEVVKFCQVLFEQNQHNCGRLLLDALNRREVDVSSVVIPSQTPPVVRSTSPKYYIEMEDLDDAFITLVREVKKVGASLDPEDLRTICIQLLNGVSSTKRNVQEDIDALRRFDGDYIGYLQPYWDSLDCNLLCRLIRQLNNSKLNEDLEKYRTQVKEACTATLEECSLPQERELPPNQISVGFQTTQPPNDVTVQKMLDLKDFLIKRMGLEEADFAGFTNSDVTLFFTVSRSRLPFLIRMCALHRRSLQDFSITVVFVPGEFIYDVITDQEFPYPEATSLGSEPVLQIKDLKEEMLHQFEQLQTSKVNEDALKYEHLQNEAIALKMKLKEEEMLRKKAEEEQQRIAGNLVKKWSESGSKSNTIPMRVISDVESLLGQSSESVEGLQDKIRILVEEWSKISEHEATSLGSEPVLQIKDLKEEMLHQFEQLQTSKVNEDAMKYESLQNKAIALEMKLKEEEMLRKKAEEEQRRIAGELMEKKWSKSGSQSNVILKKAISDVEGLLGQSSESVEGLQDKIRILVEEWSKISEHEPEDASLSAGQLHQIEDLKEEMLRQFEQLQTSKEEDVSSPSMKTALSRRGVDISSVVIPSPTPVFQSSSPKYYIEMEDLNDTFISLVKEVKKVGASLDPEIFRNICIQLLNGVSSTKRNVQEDIDALRRCDGDYIDYLQPYWDSLDCNLLHRLIRQLKKPELMSDWEKYRTQVKEACTATLEECRRSLPQGRELPSNQISVGFQTAQPPNDVTVQKMLDLKDFLIKRMGLEEADFAGFTNGLSKVGF